MTRVLIAGIGNLFLGDDAFGVEALRRLAAQAWPEGVVLREFGIRCLDLVFALGEGWTGVVVVDAVRQGHAPGTLWHLLLDQPAQPPAAPDGHTVNVESARALAQQMDIPLPPMHLIGCEPLRLAPDFDQEELSPPVAAALPEALEMVREVVMTMVGNELEVAKQ